MKLPSSHPIPGKNEETTGSKGLAHPGKSPMGEVGNKHASTESKHEPPIQLVLKAGQSAAVEAARIARYHASEAAGNAIDRQSSNPDLHRRAIQHYQDAIATRQQVNSMHVAPDQGHLDAIGVLRGRVRQRQALITRIEQRRAARAAARAAAAARGAAGDGGGGGDGVDPFRTASQASFLDGNNYSAWYANRTN